MTSSRFLTGFMLLAVAPVMLATTPVEAQVSNFADGAVSIDLGALPGGGYGPTVSVTSDEGAAPYTGGLRMPGPNRPQSQLFVAPEKSAPVRKLRVTRAAPEPAPKPKSKPIEPAAPKTAAVAPPPPMPAAPAADAPAPLTAAAPPPPAATAPTSAPADKSADVKMAEVKPDVPATPAMEAKKDDVPPPPPPPAASSAAVPPPPPPPATTPAVPTPPEPQATSTAALTPGEDGRLIRVEFDASQSKLPDSAKPNLQKLADQVKDKRDVRLQLLAYAGGDDLKSNRARRLSLSRALSVRSFLIESGIRSTRIDVRALGDKTSDEPKNRVDITLATR